MAVIRTATLERRADPAALPDAQAVVEVLLQHSLGAEGDLGADLPPALRPVAAQARAAMDAVLAEGAVVGDSARVAADLYALIDEGAPRPRTAGAARTRRRPRRRPASRAARTTTRRRTRRHRTCSSAPAARTTSRSSSRRS